RARVEALRAHLADRAEHDLLRQRSVSARHPRDRERRGRCQVAEPERLDVAPGAREDDAEHLGEDLSARLAAVVGGFLFTTLARRLAVKPFPRLPPFSAGPCEQWAVRPGGVATELHELVERVAGDVVGGYGPG